MDEEIPHPRTVGRLPKLLFSLASVYVTDERANMYPGGFSEYDNEADALEDFINTLRRINKMIMERRKKNGWI